MAGDAGQPGSSLGRLAQALVRDDPFALPSI